MIKMVEVSKLKIDGNCISRPCPNGKGATRLLRKSIKEHGMLMPLDVNSRMVVLDGVQRYKAALALGMKKFLS